MSHAIGTLRNGRRGENEDGYRRFLLPPPLQMHTQNSGCEARPDELIPSLSIELGCGLCEPWLQFAFPAVEAMPGPAAAITLNSR
jgi:hypothetical protein